MKDYKELKQIVDQLEATLREAAPQAEAECEYPKALVETFRDTGFFKIWAPKKLGGWDIDPVTACKIFEDLAYIDSAAAWVVQMSNAVGVLGRFFEDRAAEEMFGDGNAIFADAFSPPGSAVPVEGGYRLTGQFPFGSGCRHADWFISLGLVMDGDAPRMSDGAPVIHMMAFPMSDAEVVNNWDTLGMRGTGSHDVKVTDLFIPAHRSPPLMPIADANNQAWGTEINKLTIWHIHASIAAIPLGIARAAMDEFVGLTASKVPAFRAETVNTQALAHNRLGEGRATLTAAKAGLYETLGCAWASANEGDFITVEQKCDIQLAASYAARAACDAIERISASAGTTVVRNGTKLNRHLRDLRTITQHAFISRDRYADAGCMLLGQTPGWGFMQF